MMRGSRYIFAILLLGAFHAGHAQWTVKKLPGQSRKSQHLRTAEIDSTTLSLPFWNDFSQSRHFPDSTHWMNSDHVNISPGAAINPPSLNVATFDGVDQYGMPYSTEPLAYGRADALTSRFIDMREADEATTYLTFYYQAEGLGELPDTDDSLSLFIRNDLGDWVKAWNISGGEMASTGEFEFASVKIEAPEFFHEYFQFQFVAYGRLSGPYDAWHVDYVLLNDDRTDNDFITDDRALATPPSSVFKKHTSVPYAHLMHDPTLYLGTVKAGFFNLHDQVQPVNYSALLREQGSGNLVGNIYLDSVANPTPEPRQRREFFTQTVPAALFEGIGDSLYLEVFFYINSGDSIRPGMDSIDFKVNDTASFAFSVHEDLAYDDGSAEYGAGLNSTRAQLAYRFYTPVEDQITGLKIYFPNFGETSGSPSIVLKVWDHLDDDSGLKFSQETIAQTSFGQNEFIYYKFFRPVAVSDTFYVGYEQLLDNFLPVGLDKNTDTGDDVFFNIGVDWEQNTELTGSLMIRPVFGDAEDVVTELEPRETEEAQIYPNPSHGTFFYKGERASYEVTDLYGRRRLSGTLEENATIDLTGQKPGIYLLRVWTGAAEKSYKLMLK